MLYLTNSIIYSQQSDKVKQMDIENTSSLYL